MDLRKLRYFVAIVDAGSLSKASERLHIAQPSLSQQLAAMEADLGLALLLRNSQGIAPTEAGNTLYRGARQLLRQFDQLRAEVTSSVGDEVGRVTIGLPTSVAALLAAPLVRAVRQRHPGIHLHVVESMSRSLDEQLASGRLDFAVLFRDAESRGIAAFPLLRDALAFYSKRGSAAASAVTSIRQLDGVPLVLPGPGNGLRQLLERAFARAGASLNAVADVDSLPALMELASGGEVGTVLSRGLTGLAGAHGLQHFAMLDPDMHRTVSLCWTTSAVGSSAIDAVRHLVVEHCRSLRLEGGWDGALEIPPGLSAV
ncbi:LysR family transcriptional regulator [Xylophilus rhododendri]|uniref:LysR family transcriptional regulator n=2 Tax=Xylophilus rhododendri TaxID=2697032 RepID=A0A857JFC1_9BURK|nr:LysR family transcriptional regulator [Xylophilus rhododendri]